MNLNKGDLVRLTRTSEEWGLELEPITGIVLSWEYLFTRGRGGCIDLQILEIRGGFLTRSSRIGTVWR